MPGTQKINALLFIEFLVLAVCTFFLVIGSNMKIAKQEAAITDKGASTANTVSSPGAEEPGNSVAMLSDNGWVFTEKNNLSDSTPSPSDLKPSPIVVLYYHAVDDKINGIDQLFVSPAEFDKQLNYLKTNGYTAISFDQIDQSANIEKPVIITFDDGYEDNYTYAYPILKKYNFTATIFICSDFIDRSFYLNRNQIFVMKDLIRIQSHTITHRNLDKLTDIEIEKELKDSKSILEEITQQPVNALAYPNGIYNNKTIDIAKKYYDYAVTIDSGIYQRSDSPYEMKRIYIPRKLTLDDFVQKIQKFLPPDPTTPLPVATPSTDAETQIKLQQALGLYDQGLKLYYDRKFEPALELFNQALAANPNCYQALNGKGATYAFLGRYDEGIALIHQAIELKVDFEYAHFNLGLANELAGRWDAAIAAYQSALDLDPEDVWSYFGIASIYGRQGNVDQTVLYLKQAIALQSDVKELAKEENDFNPVKNNPQFQALLN